jgi:hypothetical protein
MKALWTVYSKNQNTSMRIPGEKKSQEFYTTYFRWTDCTFLSRLVHLCKETASISTTFFQSSTPPSRLLWSILHHHHTNTIHHWKSHHHPQYDAKINRRSSSLPIYSLVAFFPWPWLLLLLRGITITYMWWMTIYGLHGRPAGGNM